jgi:septum site-determining protein MinC
LSSKNIVSQNPAVELKGRMLSVTRLRVLDNNLDAIGAQIDALALQIPQAVKGMAVLIEAEVTIALRPLLERLRAVGMQPIGVVEGPAADEARALGLPVLSKDSGRTSAPRESRAETAAAEAPAARAETAPPPPGRSARIITEPVRSGQQIYAEGADLVILNSVSPGAEVIADGCVHIYGPLRGRAIAGARGDESARIFCRKLEAELLSVAGIYAVAEQIKDGPRGEPAQIYLDRGRLKIEPHKI